MDISLLKNGIKFHDLPLEHKTDNGSMDFIKVILLNVFFLHTKRQFIPLKSRMIRSQTLSSYEF